MRNSNQSFATYSSWILFLHWQIERSSPLIPFAAFRDEVLPRTGTR